MVRGQGHRLSPPTAASTDIALLTPVAIHLTGAYRQLHVTLVNEQCKYIVQRRKKNKKWLETISEDIEGVRLDFNFHFN